MCLPSGGERTVQVGQRLWLLGPPAERDRDAHDQVRVSLGVPGEEGAEEGYLSFENVHVEIVELKSWTLMDRRDDNGTVRREAIISI